MDMQEMSKPCQLVLRDSARRKFVQPLMALAFTEGSCQDSDIPDIPNDLSAWFSCAVI
jgi:hypothetical protein